MTNRLMRVTLVIALLTLGGCAKHVPLTTQQTLQLNTAKSLAALSELNKGVTATVIQLSNSNAIRADVAREILGYNRTVAESVKTAITVMDGAASPADKSAAIMVALNSIAHPPASVEAFRKSPGIGNTAAGLAALVNSMVGMIQGLIGGAA